jgi:hypothetical protein
MVIGPAAPGPWPALGPWHDSAAEVTGTGTGTADTATFVRTADTTFLGGGTAWAHTIRRGAGCTTGAGAAGAATTGGLAAGLGAGGLGAAGKGAVLWNTGVGVGVAVTTRRWGCGGSAAGGSGGGGAACCRWCGGAACGWDGIG